MFEKMEKATKQLLDKNYASSGYFTDIPHTLQITTDSSPVNAIFSGKLFKRLFALYIVSYNLCFIPAFASIKLTVAIPYIYSAETVPL